MSSIGKGCDSLGKTFLTSLVGNFWATGWFRVNSYSVMEGLICFPSLLLKGNAILQLTPKADCDRQHCENLKEYYVLVFMQTDQALLPGKSWSPEPNPPDKLARQSGATFSLSTSVIRMNGNSTATMTAYFYVSSYQSLIKQRYIK